MKKIFSRKAILCVGIALLSVSVSGADQHDELLEKWRDLKGQSVKVDNFSLHACIDVRKVRETGVLAVLLHNDNDRDLFVRTESFWYARSRDNRSVQGRNMGLAKYTLAKGRGSDSNLDGVAFVEVNATSEQDVNAMREGANIVVPIELISRKDGSALKFRLRIDTATEAVAIDAFVNPLEKLLPKAER